MTDDPINDAIERALKRNGLREAEELTGESYKESKRTESLGFALHVDASEQQEAILSFAGDLYWGMPFDRFLLSVHKGGFEEVLNLPFEGEHKDRTSSETFKVFWHPDGLLLVCDSYEGLLEEQVINKGDVYYNWEPNPDTPPFQYTATGGFTEDGIWIGNHHYIAMLYRMQNLRKHGEFVLPWVKRPFFWLTHWMDERCIPVPKPSTAEDWKKNSKWRDELTEQRIQMLPAHVKEALGKKRKDEI